MKTIFCLPFLLVVSCGLITPVKDSTVNHVLDATVSGRQASGSSPAVAIARPSLPGYLDRQQLVSRGRDGRIMMNGNQLWAEPLDTGISRVTAMNLGRLTNSLNIQPVEAFVTLDYEHLLEIRVSRFEPDADGNLVLDCIWKLQPVSGRVANPQKFSTLVVISGDQTPLSPQTERIAAMNEALARLAREIARAL